MVLALLPACLHAQDEDYGYEYLEIGVGDGTHGSFKALINVIVDDNVFTGGYYYNARRSVNTPTDYSRGLLETYPLQGLSVGVLMYGKTFFVPAHIRRYTLKGGIALGDYVSCHDFAPGGYGTYRYKSSFTFTGGLILNPCMDLPIGGAFGFSLGLFSILTPIESTFGVECNIMIGNVCSPIRRPHYRG